MNTSKKQPGEKNQKCALDEEGLVVLDQRDDVAPGDVAVVDDREARGVESKANVAHRAASDRGAHGAAVEHAGQDDVVRVLRAAGGLAESVLAGNARAD